MSRPFFLMAPLLLTACAGGTDKDDTGWVTWYQDVQPVVQGRCVQCHGDDTISQDTLVSYADSVTWFEQMSADATSGSMPIWRASGTCNTYQHDPTLTDDQVQIFVDYANFAAQRGNPDKPGAALASVGPSLSNDDADLLMSSAYTPVGAPDDFRCFALPWSEGDAFITGLGVTPGEPSEVQGAVLYSVGPADAATVASWDTGQGYACYGGPTPEGDAAAVTATWLGDWMPGTTGADLPENTGLKIAAGSEIILALHYNVANGAVADQSEVSFSLADSVTKEEHTAGIYNPTWASNPTSMTISAGDAAATATYGFNPSANMTLYLGALGMRGLGKSAKLWVVHTGGAEDCVVQEDAWDLDWQGSYALSTPI